MKTFADAEVVLAEALPGYESRPPQQRMAQAVERLFAHEPNFAPRPPDTEDDFDWVRPGLQHTLAQAGTGTGKSLGYLIPALLSGKRVVVSVTTKALQDQLASKDLPFLEEHLGVEVKWALLKGRSNYLCMNRLALVSEADVPNFRQIVEATKDPDFDGLRESFGFEIPHGVWGQICSESEECSENRCTQAECYATRARAKAETAQIIVANHALFFTDLMVKTWGMSGMLGEYQAVIFDEAHELEEVAGSTLGGKISEGSFGSFGAQVRRWATSFGDDDGDTVMGPLGRMNEAVRSLFEALPVGRIRVKELTDAADNLAEVYEALKAVREAIGKTPLEHTPDYVRAAKKKKQVQRGAYSLQKRLEQVIADPMEETVRWVSEENTRQGRRKVIEIAPIRVAPFLYRHLFSKTPCVLTSATLAVKGSFDYICQRLGIGPHEGLDVGTPFDYPRQGRLYVPVNIPAPQGSDQAEWQGMALQEIYRLLMASQGRALVLFTSVKHMRETKTALGHMLRGSLEMRMQGEAPTPELVEWLRDHNPEEPGKVLLATKSFFTGVDVPGEALSLVIIAKMPFPVPTEPLVEARCDAIEAAGGSAFFDYSIPVMSLILQQAAGRLIRHRGDTGVVAVLDPRLATKGYGKQIMRDLPPMTKVFSLQEVTDFLDQHRTEAVPA